MMDNSSHRMFAANIRFSKPVPVPARYCSHTCCMYGGSALVLTPQYITALFLRRSSKSYME